MQTARKRVISGLEWASRAKKPNSQGSIALSVDQVVGMHTGEGWDHPTPFRNCARKDFEVEKFKVVRECVSYEPLTGEFKWLIKPKHGRAAQGDAVGRLNSDGYVRFNARRVAVMAHQYAWWLHHGNVPMGMLVDHKNGIRGDNRLENLRLLTVQENTQNRHRTRGETRSGLLGVSWQPQSSKVRPWKASICAGGKVTQLGSFADKFEAHQAYIEAKRRLHPTWVEVQQ